jgi:hypothetical protein
MRQAAKRACPDFLTLKIEEDMPPKYQLNFNGLYVAISNKLEIFIITILRISDAEYKIRLLTIERQINAPVGKQTTVCLLMGLHHLSLQTQFI